MKHKDTEIAFLSGLFDIKGTIKIETPKKSKTASLYIWITDKHFSLMEFLQSFGCRIGRKNDGQYRAKWKDRNAHNILKMILPYLVTKKDQAEVGIEFYEGKERNLNIQENEIPLKLRLRLLKRDDPDE